MACEAGTFSNWTGAAVCSKCSGGLYQNSTGAVGCISCSVGLNISGQSACVLCSPGSYQANTIDSTCTSCVPGINFNLIIGATACNACTQCGQDQFFATSCTNNSDSTCAECGACPFGWYASGQCVRGSSLDARYTQPFSCQECPPCPAGTFLSDGCANNAPPVCTNCTVCEGPTVIQCTPLSDTVCPGVSDCRHNMSYEVLPWLQPSYYCRQGEYLVGLDLPALTPSCARCPEGTYGPNGLWCEACGGYKTAYFDATQCVCYQGTTQNERDNCDCAAGNEFLDNGCVPCAAGTFSNTSLELLDEWWTQYNACQPCPDGTDSLPGATACTACPFGMFRVAGDTELCQNCSEIGHYAKDPATNLSCVPCNASCAPGSYPSPCPTYEGKDLFLCQPCAALPDNAVSTAARVATANTACNWECEPGYYQANGSACVPCTAGPCPPGYNRSACTPLADSNCDAPCEDPIKPLRNSVWTSGCSWGCAEGYELSAVDYVLWVQYSCVTAGAQLFALWG